VTRVLVVDSDPGSRRALSEMLESAGFTTAELTAELATGAAGIVAQVASAATHAEAVILDVGWLGRPDGRAVHHSLRADARTAWLPILLVGWHAGWNLEVGLAGASYYLARPFTPTVLRSRLRHLIRHAAVATAALAGLAAVQTGPLAAEPWDD
jgi:DNA-binding response OmpR family regulator